MLEWRGQCEASTQRSWRLATEKKCSIETLEDRFISAALTPIASLLSVADLRLGAAKVAGS
jgi:hypothetical protein